jgi:hypothetical protein
VRALAALAALGALLAAAAGTSSSSAAFTASKANAKSTFSTAADWVAPAVTVSTPADGSATSDTTPALAGTAGSATGGGAVTVRIYAGSSASGTPAQTLTAARSGSSWSATAATLTDGTYTVRATQPDAAGNTGTSAARTFTVDTVKPTATMIATANASGGTAGRVEQGDSLTFSFSEAIRPTSVLSTFTGSSASVVVRFTHNASYGDFLTVLDSAENATVALDLGTASGLGGGVYTGGNFVTGTVDFAATMTRSADGRSFAIVLGAPDRSSRIVAGPAAAADMIWAPKAGPTDLAGNGLANTTWVTESDQDREF